MELLILVLPYQLMSSVLVGLTVAGLLLMLIAQRYGTEKHRFRDFRELVLGLFTDTADTDGRLSQNMKGAYSTKGYRFISTGFYLSTGAAAPEAILECIRIW